MRMLMQAESIQAKQVAVRQGYRVPNDVHHELLNWARWCWTGEWPHPSMVRFIEEDDEAVRPPPPNARNAQLVQTAWERMHLQARLVLRAEYPLRTGQGRAAEAKRLHMTPSEYEAALAWAVRRIQEAFDAVCA
jgi:hypothetical protein